MLNVKQPFVRSISHGHSSWRTEKGVSTKASASGERHPMYGRALCWETASLRTKPFQIYRGTEGPSVARGRYGPRQHSRPLNGHAKVTDLLYCASNMTNRRESRDDKAPPDGCRTTRYCAVLSLRQLIFLPPSSSSSSSSPRSNHLPIRQQTLSQHYLSSSLQQQQ